MSANDDDPVGGLEKYAKSPGILWRGWTMPANEALLTIYNRDERSAARTVAIAVIIFLMVCLKGSPTVGSVATGIAGYVLTYALNVWVKGKEPTLISAYTLMIVTLLFTLVLPVFIEDTAPYQYFDRLLGAVGGAVGIAGLTNITPILFAIPIAFVLWYIKARFWDRNQISLETAGWAAETTILAGAIISLVGWLPKSIFDQSGA